MKRRQSNPSNTGGKGAKRMREFGYKLVGVWMDKAEHESAQAAADKAGLPLATWMRKLANEASGRKHINR